MTDPIRVTVWGENVHEGRDESVRKIYPDTMHETIAAALRAKLGEDVAVRTAWLQQPEHGLTEEVLAETDVLTWWGHAAHGDVDDAIVERVQRHVLSGMGLIALHSAHFSKIFIRLMGTTCSLDWRAENDRELIWTVAAGPPDRAGHPAPAGDRAGGDVRRAVRHPAARRAGLRQLVHRRRGVPLRLLLTAAARAGSSTSGRATRSSRPTTSRRSSRSSPTRPAGRPRQPAPAAEVHHRKDIGWFDEEPEIRISAVGRIGSTHG